MKGKKETRKKILFSAKEVFLEKGFINTKIDDITSKSNISHGTFYIYFKNKNELLYDLVEETFEDFYNVTEKPWSKGNIHASLQESIRGFLLTYKDNLAIIKAWREVALSDQRFMNLWDEMLNKITKRIEQNIYSSLNKGLLSSNFNPVLTALILSGMVEHAAYNLFIKDQVFDIEEVSNTLANLWYNAIYKE